MIHLTKQSTTAIQGVELKRMACVNSPFIKGRIVDKDEFEKCIEINPSHCCKKCQSILKGLK